MGHGFAFIRLSDGLFRIGHGPFLERSTPGDAACFYVNDWSLSDPKPWKVPSRLEVVESFDTVLECGDEALSVDWIAPERSRFEPVFSAVDGWIRSGETRKMVPVVSELGEFRQRQGGHRLVGRIAEAAEELWPYGFLGDEEGFAGATPEVLFSMRGNAIETMALAGTVPTAGRASFLEDPKEINEHEMVVEHIVTRLSEIGAVERSRRTLFDLEGLSHFCSEIRARVPGGTSMGELVGRLHPTPAVGTLPATEALRGRLLEMRNALDTPDWFGAPFGFAEGDAFHCVVAIRGIGWKGNRAVVPSGCGVVAGSDLEREWEELELKRNSVKKLFGL